MWPCLLGWDTQGGNTGPQTALQSPQPSLGAKHCSCPSLPNPSPTTSAEHVSDKPEIPIDSWRLKKGIWEVMTSPLTWYAPGDISPTYQWCPVTTDCRFPVFYSFCTLKLFLIPTLHLPCWKLRNNISHLIHHRHTARHFLGCSI